MVALRIHSSVENEKYRRGFPESFLSWVLGPLGPRTIVHLRKNVVKSFVYSKLGEKHDGELENEMRYLQDRPRGSRPVRTQQRHGCG